MEMMRLYLYLGKRDKAGIKVVSVLQGPKISAKVNNVKELKLDGKWEQKLSRIVYDNRMDYDLYIESATDFKELREKLKKIGYKNIPTSCNFSFPDMASYKNPETTSMKTSGSNTMLRKANKN